MKITFIHVSKLEIKQFYNVSVLNHEQNKITAHETESKNQIKNL